MPPCILAGSCRTCTPTSTSLISIPRCPLSLDHLGFFSDFCWRRLTDVLIPTCFCAPAESQAGASHSRDATIPSGDSHTTSPAGELNVPVGLLGTAPQARATPAFQGAQPFGGIARGSVGSPGEPGPCGPQALGTLPSAPARVDPESTSLLGSTRGDCRSSESLMCQHGGRIPWVPQDPLGARTVSLTRPAICRRRRCRDPHGDSAEGTPPYLHQAERGRNSEGPERVGDSAKTQLQRMRS
eukprot:jgi/Botrbrau1/11322/Bobra.0038s0082.1